MPSFFFSHYVHEFFLTSHILTQFFLREVKLQYSSLHLLEKSLHNPVKRNLRAYIGGSLRQEKQRKVAHISVVHISFQILEKLLQRKCQDVLHKRYNSEPRIKSKLLEYPLHK
mgnify:CR=1 FL=1